MQAVCELYGYTRQAWYKQKRGELKRELDKQRVLLNVRQIRKRQPRVGGKKLHRMLQAQDIDLGRDKLFDILRENRLLVKPRKRYTKTTYSHHRFRKYKNLIREVDLTRPNQIYVSDITYIDTLEGFCYLALITDKFSKKIVGWDLSNSLSIEGARRALKKALARLDTTDGLIHHSDRGIQYCSHKYVEDLESRNIKISMTEENHCYENAVAERVNGILKTEFMLGDRLKSHAIAKELVAEAVKIYNEERLHLSLDYQTPAKKHAA